MKQLATEVTEITEEKPVLGICLRLTQPVIARVVRSDLPPVAIPIIRQEVRWLG